MDKKTLFEKSDKAINQAFEMVKHSVKIVSEKAGVAAHVTRLLIEKATLEHRVSKKFAEIGSWVYEKALKESDSISLKDSKIKDLIAETRKLDRKLSRMETALKQEQENKKGRQGKKTKSP